MSAKKTSGKPSTVKGGTQKKALGEGTGPTGGYLVPKPNTIIKKPKKK